MRVNAKRLWAQWKKMQDATPKNALFMLRTDKEAVLVSKKRLRHIVRSEQRRQDRGGEGVDNPRPTKVISS